MVERFQHYLTGIEEIDRGHKEIMELALNFEESETKTQEELDDLVALLTTHWAEEEAHMDSVKYPFIEHHKNHHKFLIQFTKDLEKRTKIGPLHRYDSVSLTDKFLSHIDHFDLQFADWLKKNLPK